MEIHLHSNLLATKCTTHFHEPLTCPFSSFGKSICMNSRVKVVRRQAESIDKYLGLNLGLIWLVHVHLGFSRSMRMDRRPWAVQSSCADKESDFVINIKTRHINSKDKPLLFDRIDRMLAEACTYVLRTPKLREIPIWNQQEKQKWIPALPRTIVLH